MKDANNQLELVKNQIGEQAVQTFHQSQNEQQKTLLLKMLGAITALDASAHSVSTLLSSQALRGMQKIEQEKLYLALGYENFVEFLNSDDSPITKNQYYDRIKLLNSENDTLYDALTKLAFPVSKRKLLNKGQVQIEGDTVFITVPETGEQMPIALDDRTRLLETLSALADANAEKSKKIERGRDDNDRLKRKISDLEDRAQTAPSAARVDELEAQRLAATSALARLAELLDAATLVRCQQFFDSAFEPLTAQWNRIQTVLDRKLPGSIEAPSLMSLPENARKARIAAQLADYEPDASVFDDDED